MAWQIGMAIAGGLANIGVGLLQRPKKHRPDLSYLDKYVANLRGDLAKRTVERNILREGSRHIGDMSRQAMHQADYQAHRTGTVGTGLHVGQQQQIQQGQQRAMADVTRQAGAVTAQQTAQTQEQIRQAELHRDQVEAQVSAEYDAAKSAWKRDMWGRGIQSAVNVGSAVASHEMAMKDATAVARAEGVGAQQIASDLATQAPIYSEPSLAEVRRILKDTGAATPQAMLQAVGIERDRERGENFVRSLVESMGIIDFSYNRQWSPEQNLKIVQATEEYQTNTMVLDILDDVSQQSITTGEPMPYQDILTRTLSELPETMAWNTKLKVAQSIYDTQLKMLEPAEEEAGFDVKTEVSDLYWGIKHGGVSKQDYIDRVNMLRKADIAIPIANLTALDRLFETRGREALTTETAHALYTVSLREAQQDLLTFKHDVIDKADTSMQKFSDTIDSTIETLLGDEPLTLSNIDSMIESMGRAIDSLDERTLDRMYRTVSFVEGRIREVVSPEYASVAVKRNELKRLLTGNLREMIRARAYGVGSAQVRDDESFIRGF